jgi:hypothetical protein
MLAAMFAGENPAVAKFGSPLVGNNPFDSKLAGQRQRFLFTFSQTPVPTKNPHTTFFSRTCCYFEPFYRCVLFKVSQGHVLFSNLLIHHLVK